MSAQQKHEGLHENELEDLALSVETRILSGVEVDDDIRCDCLILARGVLAILRAHRTLRFAYSAASERARKLRIG